MDKTEIVKYILTGLEKKTLQLPTLPNVALQVKSVAEDPDANLNELAREIASDAAITTRLLQVANSPLYRTAIPAESLNQVISRLGMNMVSNLVVSLAMKQLFKAESPTLTEYMQELWERTIQISAISRMLVEQHRNLGFNPEFALLAGLVHCIGSLPIIAAAEKFSEIAESKEALISIIDELAPLLGGKILKRWNFPAYLVEVASQQHDDKYDHDGPADYVDLVIVSRLQSSDPSDEERASWVDVPAFAKLGVDPMTNVIDEDFSEIIDLFG